MAADTQRQCKRVLAAIQMLAIAVAAGSLIATVWGFAGHRVFGTAALVYLAAVLCVPSLALFGVDRLMPLRAREDDLSFKSRNTPEVGEGV